MNGKRSWATSIGLLACAMFSGTANAQATSVESIAPRIEAVRFESSALGVPKTFCAVVPAQYDKSADPWPVLFLFHGRGRHERSLIDDPAARAALLDAPFVTILPDGDDGWYINAPARPEDRYQDYIDEVIAVATRQYHLSTAREHRGLSGWSMGGYGCTRYAIDNAEKFGVLAPIIGLLDFPRDGLPEGQSYAVPVDRFGTDEATWNTLNPLHRAEALRGTAVCIITGTTAFDRTMNLNFSRKLADLEIPHTLHVIEGGHTFDVVRESLPLVVNFVAESFEDTVDKVDGA